ncbi:hypothetical protein CF327_g7579 [Tilletia walkeri]|nr:hypothetical protein CF327_g7579 [Tilletia walkeri]
MVIHHNHNKAASSASSALRREGFGFPFAPHNEGRVEVNIGQQGNLIVQKLLQKADRTDVVERELAQQKEKYEKLKIRRERERLNRGVSPELQGAEHWFEARSTRPRILQHLGPPLLQPVAYRARRHGQGVGMPPGPPPSINTNSPAPAPAAAAPSSLLSHHPSPIRPHIFPPVATIGFCSRPQSFRSRPGHGLAFLAICTRCPWPCLTLTYSHFGSRSLSPRSPPPAPAFPHQDIPGLIADAVGASEARMWRELYEVRDGLIRSWAAGPS